MSILQKEFAARRRELMAHMEPNSIAIIPAGQLQIRNRDVEFPFRQDSDFFYLTGFNEPDAILVLLKSATGLGSCIMFCQPKDALAEIWHGRRLGCLAAVEQLGLDDAFDNTDISFTANPADLAEATFFIVAVPTPVDKHKVPNLGPVLSASKALGNILKKGDYVVYESTVYPGCTEEDCIPVLEAGSGLKFVDDFKVGFSPERINPGDKEHTITKILKVVSGCDDESLDIIAKVYESIITAGVHRAPTIKVAEAAKVIENTQRDVNIALMNELSIIFDKMGIDTQEVIAAAGTKRKNEH